MGGGPPTVRALEAASGLGRLAGTLRLPTRARPRTQNPSRARVARCELAHDHRLERRQPAVHWRRSRRRSRLLAIAESRTSGNSRPAAASARRRPRKVDAAPAAACHARCIDPQAPSRTGARALGAPPTARVKYARTAATRAPTRARAHAGSRSRIGTSRPALTPRRTLRLRAAPCPCPCTAPGARVAHARATVPRSSRVRHHRRGPSTFGRWTPRACMPLTRPPICSPPRRALCPCVALPSARVAGAHALPSRAHSPPSMRRELSHRVPPRLCRSLPRPMPRRRAAPLPSPLLSPSPVMVWPSRCGVNPAPVESRRRARHRPRPCGVSSLRIESRGRVECSRLRWARVIARATSLACACVCVLTIEWVYTTRDDVAGPPRGGQRARARTHRSHRP